MTELFADIPDEVKHQAEIVFNLAIMQNNVPAAVELLQAYLTTCTNEEERDFADFYFSMKLEELVNGSSTN